MLDSKIEDIEFKSPKWLVIVCLIFAMLSWPSVSTVASYIETRYYPVVSDMTITKWERTPDGFTDVEGMYTRNRDCTFEHVNWYLKGANSDIAIPLQRVPRDVDRPPGTYEFGPWKLFASQEELESSAYGIVYHSCHPFYDTKSIIYAKGKFK